MSDCCVSKQNGFKCTCLPKRWSNSQQAEDDGKADHDYDRDRDSRDMEGWEQTESMKNHNEYRGADYGED